MRGNEMVRFIPFEAKGGRVETGATQIGNDWPGLFIRGDDCIYLQAILDRYLSLDNESSLPQLLSTGFIHMIVEEIKNNVLIKKAK
jgi:hypothetical protein